MRRRFAAAGTVLLAALVVGGAGSGCSTDPKRAEHRARRAGWSRVEIDGSLRSILGINSTSPRPHLYGAGRDGSRPLLVDVTDGSAREVPTEFPQVLPKGLGELASDGMNIAVSEETGDRSRPAAVWLGGDGFGWQQQPWQDSAFRPTWISPTFDGEANLRAVGALMVDGKWQLHGWQAFEYWQPMDRGTQLYSPAKPTAETVLTGSTETTLVVAGAVSETAAAAGMPPEVWSIYDEVDETGGRWQRHRTETVPDALTDMSAGDSGWWAAGHRQLRPVVYDFDSASGASMPMPDTELDPKHPAVLITGQPTRGVMTLATQSVDGPTVWVGAGTNWRRIPAPAGRLEAAQRVADGVYVLVDGGLWYRLLGAAER